MMDFESYEQKDAPGMFIGGKSIASHGTVRDIGLDFTRLFYMLYTAMDTQIDLADRKAQLILTANAILIASLTLDRGALNAILDGGVSLVERGALLLTILTLGAMFLSILYALRTTRPNLVPPQQNGNMFFWGHIIQMDETFYRDTFMNMTIEEIKLAVITQIYARSRVVAAKFDSVRRSLDYLFLALILWVVSRLLIALI